MVDYFEVDREALPVEVRAVELFVPVLHVPSLFLVEFLVVLPRTLDFVHLHDIVSNLEAKRVLLFVLVRVDSVHWVA